MDREEHRTGVSISPSSTQDFMRTYDIEKCIEWIEGNEYHKVCLQFSDELLSAAVEIAEIIEQRISKKCYVLGDATFRSCCADYNTSKHVNADALIHFGRTCLSPFFSLPTFFVLPKEFLDTGALYECVTSFIEQHQCNVVLLYDIAFAHYAGEIHSKLSSFREINVSRLLTCQDQNLKNSGRIDRIENKLGRQYSLSFHDDNRNVIYFYVFSPCDKKNLENFVLSSPENEFVAYNSSSQVLSKESIPKTIKRKLFEIQRVKEAQKIGILLATLEVDSFLHALKRIKTLCTMKKKKSYVISVGKPSNTKLANFPEIDIFVMISCPEAEIMNRKDYYQPIVSIMEIELALNDNQMWNEKCVSDFREFLIGGREYKPFDEPRSCLMESEAYFDEATANSLHSSMTLNGYQKTDLAGRSWQGLNPKLGGTPISQVVAGRDGTPAQGYKCRSSNNVT